MAVGVEAALVSAVPALNTISIAVVVVFSFQFSVLSILNRDIKFLVDIFSFFRLLFQNVLFQQRRSD